MGTRYLIIVYYRGKVHIANYGHWDGSPSFQGLTVLKFIRSPANLNALKTALDADLIDFIDDVESEKLLCDAKQSDKKIPSLASDTGAEILTLVAQAEEKIPLCNEFEFIFNWIYCEWAYILDLDDGFLEVYAHFQDELAQKFERHCLSEPRVSRDLKDYGRTILSEEQLAKYSPGPPLVGRWSINKLPSDEEFQIDLTAKRKESEDESCEEEGQEGEEQKPEADHGEIVKEDVTNE